MSAPTSPQPAPPRRTEVVTLDLDARILRAEQRLVAREESLRRRANELGARVREAWQPGRLLWPLTGAGLALVALKWLGRGRAPAPRAEAPPPRAREGGPHWVSLLGILWPLLPSSWRARVPPSVVNLATGVGLPLLETLLQRRAPAPLVTAAPVDPALLAGGWYEVARLPPRRGGGPPHWQHTFDDSGALRMNEACDDAAADCPRRGARAVATVLPESGCARWRVCDWPWLLQLLPGAWHELAVLHVDETELVLGSPARDRLRLLSRSPALAPGRLEALLTLAHQRGFDLEQLQFVDRP